MFEEAAKIIDTVNPQTCQERMMILIVKMHQAEVQRSPLYNHTML